ncbi:YjjG family noncanonical pyrimidine nucleotidase [Leeuwenhoekiella nanhaiensis]|uniref:Noncanonical pyrimidine nucleotidase, YjjG family n=1 Tax=Leeuwenhoekiella nanhaiensis TaxID=1655491 RepID=A0A2G1VRQ0_9FLAO|nr:YjjG family noncanonical pyrimidine nucleotidase [Leeuwenhoekiella nanhaiensis]PHQ29458.1 noncanonical pyrimidine nucleotidase, YjjG family [Leeuwenhoekiella nanhaiensis]
MHKLEGIKHVFFDLDHTLWDFDRNSELAFQAIFEKNRIDLPVSQFLEVYKPINFEYWKYYREARVTKEQLRYGRLKKSFDALSIQIDDFLINRLSVDYIDFLPRHNHLFDGTLELLEELEARYDLHIITNGFEEVQHLKLKNSKIDRYFKTVTSSEAVGVKKPDPKIFMHALKVADARVEESVMVGDTYEADILGAQNIGMQTIFFNYHNEKLNSGERVIDRIDAVKIYL